MVTSTAGKLYSGSALRVTCSAVGCGTPSALVPGLHTASSKSSSGINSNPFNCMVAYLPSSKADNQGYVCVIAYSRLFTKVCVDKDGCYEMAGAVACSNADAA